MSQTLFEFYQDYERLDEDYENRIIVYSGGRIDTYQSKTYCYEPDIIEKTRFNNEKLEKKIISVLDKYKSEFEKYKSSEWKKERTLYKLKIYEKKFSYSDAYNLFLSDFFQTFLNEIQEAIDSIHPNLIDWNYIT